MIFRRHSVCDVSGNPFPETTGAFKTLLSKEGRVVLFTQIQEKFIAPISEISEEKPYAI